jgi:predicted hydrolase (HD superfamily)
MPQYLLRHCLKTESLFRECKLEMDEDPEIWKTNLKALKMKFEVMDLFMTDDQFMVQVLNRITYAYDLQMLLLEKGLDLQML